MEDQYANALSVSSLTVRFDAPVSERRESSTIVGRPSRSSAPSGARVYTCAVSLV